MGEHYTRIGGGGGLRFLYLVMYRRIHVVQVAWYRNVAIQ